MPCGDSCHASPGPLSTAHGGFSTLAVSTLLDAALAWPRRRRGSQKNPDVPQAARVADPGRPRPRGERPARAGVRPPDNEPPAPFQPPDGTTRKRHPRVNTTEWPSSASGPPRTPPRPPRSRAGASFLRYTGAAALPTTAPDRPQFPVREEAADRRLAASAAPIVRVSEPDSPNNNRPRPTQGITRHASIELAAPLYARSRA